MDKEIRRGPPSSGGGDYFRHYIGHYDYVIKIIIVHSIFLLLFNRGSGGDQARIGGRARIVESSASRSSGGNFHDCDNDDDVDDINDNVDDDDNGW